MGLCFGHEERVPGDGVLSRGLGQLGIENGNRVRVGLVFDQQPGVLVGHNTRPSPHIARRLARLLGPIRCSVDPEGVVGLSDSTRGAEGVAGRSDNTRDGEIVVGDCARGCPGAVLHLGKYYRNRSQDQDNQSCLYDWLSHKEYFTHGSPFLSCRASIERLVIRCLASSLSEFQSETMPSFTSPSTLRGYPVEFGKTWGWVAS